MAEINPINNKKSLDYIMDNDISGIFNTRVIFKDGNKDSIVWSKVKPFYGEDNEGDVVVLGPDTPDQIGYKIITVSGNVLIVDVIIDKDEEIYFQEID